MVALTGVEPVNTGSSTLPPVPTWPLAGLVVGLKLRLVMSLVPDITAGTGTEFEEMLVCDGSGGLSQSEGAQERVLSVDEFLSEWDCGVR